MRVEVPSMRALLLALCLLTGCASSPEPGVTPTSRPAVALPPQQLSSDVSGRQVLETKPYVAETPTPEPTPAKPNPKPKVPAKAQPKPVTFKQPALPRPAAIPKAQPKPKPSQGLLPDKLTSTQPRPAKVAPPPDSDKEPIEIDIVPPEDLSVLRKSWQPTDPQAVLKTPQAVHFGYSYSRSLEYLVRDRLLEIDLLGTGHTTVALRVENRARRPLHFYFFPGQIFKPKKNTKYAPLLLADLQEVFLYPQSQQQFQFNCYSLDRRKALPDPEFPVVYRLEGSRDPRFPKALRTLEAILLQESAEDFYQGKEDYQQHRTTILQLALWKATSGNYDSSDELRRFLHHVPPHKLARERSVVIQEVDSLQRLANQL